MKIIIKIITSLFIKKLQCNRLLIFHENSFAMPVIMECTANSQIIDNTNLRNMPKM